jgi:hypothetical protein
VEAALVHRHEGQEGRSGEHGHKQRGNAQTGEEERKTGGTQREKQHNQPVVSKTS